MIRIDRTDRSARLRFDYGRIDDDAYLENSVLKASLARRVGHWARNVFRLRAKPNWLA